MKKWVFSRPWFSSDEESDGGSGGRFESDGGRVKSVIGSDISSVASDDVELNDQQLIDSQVTYLNA